MRQICTSRKVWLPILLLFTAVFIFACWDRGVSIDYDGTGLYCRDQAYSEPTPIHSITLDRTQRCAEIRLWSEYTVEGDRVLATFDPLMHPTLTVTE